jgi:formate-nitrite transporter family protein
MADSQHPPGDPPSDTPRKAAESAQITTEEQEDIEERSSPRAPVIYEIVRKHGEEEMTRPTVSLWWSGVAAGLSISFSLLAQALLQMHLPDEPWRPLVSCLGYSVGFLMVVLARQQLFTENTITVVLPVMARSRHAGISQASPACGASCSWPTWSAAYLPPVSAPIRR